MDEEAETTICWHCKHAVPTYKDDRSREYATGCEWSINKRPVAGWIAKERRYRESEHKKFARSFNVIHCPKFEKG